MWNLYNKEEFLEPLKFSDGKTQEDVVAEVLEAINKGEKTIFILGMCGTGKSAIALNVARNLGKTSIVVPGKSLQNQYKKDYEGDKYLLKENKQKLKISVITGRNNHECMFLKDNEIVIPKVKREVNSRLNNIFEFQKEEKKEDLSADNEKIPCKIEIKEKNLYKIKEYLRQNKKINARNIQTIGDVKRIPLASVCPYWSPVLPEKYDLKNIDYNEKRSYEGLNGVKFNIYKRKPGCKFYEQFDSYIDSDVIVFNSLKYKLESALNRKPKTEVEIIDECDEFLDSFSNQRTVNIDRLQNSLTQIIGGEESGKTSREINDLIKQIKSHPRIIEAANSRKIIPLKETPVYVLFKIFLESGNFLEEIEEESYLFDFEETVKMFEDFFDETYLSFSKKDNTLIMNVVTTNLEKRFKEMASKNKVLVLMSGTLHSEEVLRDIFGLDNFKIINAETKQPGEIEVLRTGMEFDCKHENMMNENGRELFLKSLDECLRVARKPTLVHVSAFWDLPSENEIRDFNLKNLVSRDIMREAQNNDKDGKNIESFKEGKIDVLFTTRCSRGVDFPGKQCNSIVFTKYPNPSPEEPFWKILRETNKNSYWEMYKDKARRELLQKVYRGVRFKEDHVFVLSPDSRVLRFFENEKHN
jgi:Rad3-related DNA helicase